LESPRVLLVEDEPILALEMREDLQDLGFTVVDAVGDGDMVLHAFLRHKPDVVVMDIKLLGFRDGIDSASQIRGFYSVPIVFVSSYPREAMEERLTRVKSFSYLQKPYEPRGLGDLIRGAVAART
jgi:CheY-like chemotaxis protein